MIVFYTFFIVSSRTCCRNNNFFENLCKILIIEKPKLTAIKLLYYMMFTHVSIATFVYMVAENGRYFWRVFSVIYQQIAGKHKQKGF